MGLASLGCEVHVLTAKQGSELEAKRIDAFLRSKGVLVDRIEAHFGSGNLQLEGAVQSAINLVNRYGVDLIHAHHFGAIYLGSVLKSSLEIPLVVSSHKTPLRDWVAGLVKRDALYAMMQHTTNLGAEAWIAYSKAFETELRNLNPKVNIVQIYPGVGMSGKDDTSMSSHDEVVLVPSRLDKRKGLERVIDAVSDFNRSSRTKLTILFTGTPATAKEEKYHERLRRTASEQEVQVEFRHFKFLELRSAFRGRFACVLPSDREGLGLVVLESMSQGTPVITAETNGTNEIVIDERNGLTFSLSVEGDLANRLKTLATNPGVRKTVVKGGYETISKYFDNGTAAKQHITTYTKVISDFQKTLEM